MPGPVRGSGSFCAAAQHLAFLRGVPQAALGCGVSAPARRVPFRMHEKEPKVHIRGVPLMYPPEGCPPLAGRKGHACHSPPRPVFCPDRPRPLDPGCAAKPHYSVPDRAGLPSLPGRGTRGGVADPSPVRQPAGSSRRMPRFGPQAREDPRKARAPIRLVWGQTDAALEPKTPRTFEEGASAYPFGLGPNGCCPGTQNAAHL